MGRTDTSRRSMGPAGSLAVVLLAFVVAAAFRVAARTPDAPRRDPAPAAASVAAAIDVTVLAFDRTPVPGATVTVLRESPEIASLWPGTGDASLPPWRQSPGGWDTTPVASATTDDVGRATLPAVPAGRWLVRAEAPGRVVRSRAVEVRDADLAVELLIESGHPLEGRVVTGTGETLPGYVVAASFRPVLAEQAEPGHDDEIVIARADAEGRFRFDALPECLLVLQCGTADAWSSHVTRILVPGVSRVDLVVARSPPVTGIVTDEEDRPVAGADVLLRDRGFHTANVFSHARTDAAGRFEIRDHAADAISDLDVRAPGFDGPPEMLEGRVPCRLRGGSPPARFSIRLSREDRRTPSARLRFVGREGPVQGVIAGLAGTQDAAWCEGAAPSDSDGWISFMDVPQGEVCVTLCDGAGHVLACDAATIADTARAADDDAADDASEVVPDERLLWVPGGAVVEREFALVRGASVAGHVVGPDGRPVAGASVRVGELRRTTASDGSFLLDGISITGSTVIHAVERRTDASGTSAPLVAVAGESIQGVRIELVNSRSREMIAITGRVVLAGSETPVAGARIRLADGSVIAAPDGRFRFSVRRLSARRVLAGSLSIDGHGDADLDAAVPDGASSVDLGDIEVEPADAGSHELTGTVRVFRSPHDEDGEAAPFARILVAGAGGSPLVIACGPNEDPEPPIVAVADAEGRFRIADFRGDASRLRAVAPGTIAGAAVVDPSAVEGDPTVVMLPLFQAATMRVRVVTPDGAPMRRARIESDDESDDDIGAFPEYEWTDGNGRAELVVRKGAAQMLSVEPNDPDDLDPFIARQSGPHMAGPDEVVVVVNRGALIRGVVVADDGEPVAGARVTAELEDDGDDEDDDDASDDGERPPRRRRCVSAADGAFELAAVGTGAYRVTARRGLFGAPGVVVRGGTDAVTLRLPPRSLIEGVVIGLDGRPARGAALLLEDVAEDEWKSWVRTDVAGRFRAEVAAGAAYSIRLLSDGAPRGEEDEYFGPASPLDGGTAVRAGTTGLTLRVPGARASSLTVKVRRPDGAAAEGVRWEAQTSERSRVTSSTWESGVISVGDVPLGTEVPVSVLAGGIGWTLPIRAGSHATTLVVAPEGLISARDGERVIGAATAWVTVARGPGDAEGRPSDHIGIDDGADVRLVHATTGAGCRSGEVIEPGSASDDCPFDPLHYSVAILRFGDLPVGPYRVEVRTETGGAWREAVLVTSNDGSPWFRVESD